MRYTLKKTLEQIVASGNDYLVAVKGNQGRLHQHLQTYDTYLKPIAERTVHQRHRGRDEYRCVKVYHPAGVVLNEWETIASVLCIERWGTRNGKDYHHWWGKAVPMILLKGEATLTS